MSDNIKSKVISKIDSSPVFALQLDESTDVSNLSQLLVYARYVDGGMIIEEFLFCQPLETTSKAADVFQVLDDFFTNTGLSWSKLVGVCTDGAPAMIGAKSGLVSLIKQRNPEIQGTHCMIHKAALVSKTIPKRLHEHLSVVIKLVNYVKSSALSTRLFRKLCKDMDADHTTLLYHTQVRWLSKGNMLSRIFELKEEVKLFLVAQQKDDLLLAFSEDGFATYLAFLPTYSKH
uniref:protein ZBED8-like n=1 Tax=Styela clava TaxID=7725 RepID=UPI00193A88FB|nr:protein ZBED8-like [Styela clava]